MKKWGTTCLSRPRRFSRLGKAPFSPNQYSRQTVVIICAVLTFSPISKGEEPVSFAQLKHEPQLDRSTQLATEEHFKECFTMAEFNRSNRDLEFFKVSRKLSSAKTFFVSHSINNQKLFCSEFERCRRLFPPLLDDSIKKYPECGD